MTDCSQLAVQLAIPPDRLCEALRGSALVFSSAPDGTVSAGLLPLGSVTPWWSDPWSYGLAVVVLVAAVLALVSLRAVVLQTRSGR